MYLLALLLTISLLAISVIKADAAEKRTEEIGALVMELQKENQTVKAERNAMNATINNLRARLKIATKQLERCQ